MLNAILSLFRMIPLILGGHEQVVLENLALREQLAIFQRSVPHNVQKHDCERFAPTAAGNFIDDKTLGLKYYAVVVPARSVLPPASAPSRR